MADPQAAQPSAGLENRLVGVVQGLPGYSGLLGGLPLAGGVEAAAGGLGEVEVGPQHAQCGAAALAAPRSGLDPLPQSGKVLVRAVTGADAHGGGDLRAGAGPDPLDVGAGAGLTGAQLDDLGVPAALVVRVQQQPGQLICIAAGAGHVAGDGRGDPVAVLRNALTVLTADQGAPGVPPRVAAGRVAAGEVPQQDQVDRSGGEPVEAEQGGVTASDCL
ncbi:hypothetical protein [Streptacidiphilus melanogenes]|uniref:hypothetical protein n=1 Tax=Streptacidiphilus melanogenes TaxID=411235 RepID=UPI000694594F|nr:hypothetical protein [Streptacidiphilus melanogenes]